MDKVRLLIVDDQLLFAESLKTVLEIRSDFIEVIAMASNGLEAIEYADRYRPDIILMDIRMPEMDGVEATKVIHKAQDDIKIIMLTTFDDDEYIRDALSFGATGFLLKDTPPLELINSIYSASNGIVFISPSIAKHLTQNLSSSKKNIKPDWFKALSRREKQVLKLIVDGLDNRDIAAELFIAEQTVKNHVSIIYSKVNTHDRAQTIKIASEYI